MQTHQAFVGRNQPYIDSRPSSPGFGALRLAFRASGGMAHGDDLARLLHDSASAPSLARLLVSGEVFGIGWRASIWVPMFQFDLRTLSVQTAAQRLRAERFGSSAVDGWDCAAWFARSHEGLNGRRPVDLLHSDLHGVMAAARADRWVISG